MQELLNLAAMQRLKPALFETGQTVITTHLDNWANENLPKALLDRDLWAVILVNAHTRGVGWDEELPDDDAELNRLALQPGKRGRIMSVYTVAGEKIWVITEWDRSATTLLFPDDY
ncbi:hypothetical protein [Neisseria canis]|uniref:Uncharacterized protein n=1 Tax=Neisseria canis TaxID=493 RepID=A0A448D9K9_9NEIS|nr:hypothetical protein [Neisseria canis]OSI12972.1 hypothetical protein BWD07_02560 [Neisseria canis]VEF02426.1 Uncharacterised protein [Neisseria canis]